jgi:hypothetical protein
MSPSNLDGRGREYNREDTSTEARLTAAAEVRLGDRSKRWEADAADTGYLKSVGKVADRKKRGRRRDRMLITGEQTQVLRHADMQCL